MKLSKKFLLISCLLYVNLGVGSTIPAIVGQPLAPWKEGYLDIHHIHEGRGNATFMIFPDGTTLLYDLGDTSLRKEDSKSLERYSDTIPNNSKPAYEWVANYIKNFSPNPSELDYLVVSHYHFDHMGEWNSARKYQLEGHYQLFGVTGLADQIHIHTLIDRSYPDYNYHGDIHGKLSNYLKSKDEYARITAQTMQNYKIFLQYQIKYHGLNVEKFQVGSSSQIYLLKHHYNDFQVRNVIGNGYVWTGKNNDTYLFTTSENDPNHGKLENDLSLGIRITYGSFRYFTGGDITGLSLTGQEIDTSAEAVAAPVIGKVDVATFNHHGFADAQSEKYVSILRPSVWIQQNWAASQTSLPMLMRTLDSKAYPYQRDLFSLHHFILNDLSLPTFGNPENASAVDSYYKASMGHVVVRVEPGGKRFWVILLSSNTENPIVQGCYGPYSSMEK